MTGSELAVGFAILAVLMVFIAYLPSILGIKKTIKIGPLPCMVEWGDPPAQPSPSAAVR